MIAAFDADIICYRAALSAVQTVDFEDGEDPSTFVDIDRATDAVEEIIAEWSEALPAHREKLMCFSDTNNFRKVIFPEYKANRKDKPKPQGFGDVINYVKANYPHLTHKWLEADDVIGVLMTDPEKDVIGVSIDKDFATIPGRWYDPMSFEGVVTTSIEDADRAHMIQTMVGDTTDNYKGIPGIGPKKAEKILDTWTSGLWDTTPENLRCSKSESFRRAMSLAYRDAGLTFEDCLTQARMAFILRHDYFDDMTGELMLWNSDYPVKFNPANFPQ